MRESPATHEAETAIILVPGYYGTRLVREADRKLVWISAREALFGRRSLALPIPGLGIEAEELKPDGILRTIRVVPLFYAVDAYGSILDALDTSFHGRARIIPFAYDWRGDLMEAVRGLGAVVSRLRTEGVQRIAIVAHSMGGLITAYYLRYGTQSPDEAIETWEGAAKFDAVAMAGVPFQGTMTVFRNMQQGVTIGWNRSILTGTAVASFPASYFVLPFLKQDELVTPRLQVVGGLIRKAENWSAEGWGLLKDDPSQPFDIRSKRAHYTATWLTRSQRFLERLWTPSDYPSSKRLPLLYLYGTGKPTLARGLWEPGRTAARSSLRFDTEGVSEMARIGYENSLFSDGDGTVTVPSAALPPAYIENTAAVIEARKARHGELIAMPGLQQEMVAFLTHALERGGAVLNRAAPGAVSQNVMERTVR